MNNMKPNYFHVQHLREEKQGEQVQPVVLMMSHCCTRVEPLNVD